MNKEAIIVLFLVLILSAGAFAQSEINSDIGEDVEKYLDNFVKKEYNKDSVVNEIKKVDTSNLPQEINIEDIKENKVGIYQVDYNVGNEEKKVYVVTYSSDNIDYRKQEEKTIGYFGFGYSGLTSQSAFLQSASGVNSSKDIGYVMTRRGSITGISSSMEMNGESGEVEIIIYKNGVDSGFRNLIGVNDNKKLDYDKQSDNILTFEAGDVISVYVRQNGELNWGNVVTLVETTFN